MREYQEGADLETVAAQRALGQVVDILAALLERPSRWSGEIELTDSLFTSGIAHLNGRIEITRAVWRQPQYQWRTIIHEALHLFSPAYTKHEYSLARGWEEGVVEQLQRLFRQSILKQIGVDLAESVFAERDSQHEYNIYIQALESLRQPLNIPSLDFYRRTLAIPLPERVQAVLGQGNLLPEQEKLAFRRCLLLAQAKLGRL